MIERMKDEFIKCSPAKGEPLPLNPRNRIKGSLFGISKEYTQINFHLFDNSKMCCLVEINEKEKIVSFISFLSAHFVAFV